MEHKPAAREQRWEVMQVETGAGERNQPSNRRFTKPTGGVACRLTSNVYQGSSWRHVGFRGVSEGRNRLPTGITETPLKAQSKSSSVKVWIRICSIGHEAWSQERNKILSPRNDPNYNYLYSPYGRRRPVLNYLH
jgi:hypothetical protein